MDAEQNRLDQFPRNLFFQAVDYQVGPKPLSESDVKVIQNSRYAANRRLHTQLEHLVRALKSVESFDPMGNAGLAAINLGELSLDVHKQIRNFVADIEAAEDRYGDELDALHTRDAAIAALATPDAVELTASMKAPAAVEPTPQAQTAAGPKPSDVAQVQANLTRALERVSR